MSNQITLCRRCHEAKHGRGVAPTVRLRSTGTMTEMELEWFKHCMEEVMPALARQVDIRVKPKFNVAREDA